MNLLNLPDDQLMQQLGGLLGPDPIRTTAPGTPMPGVQAPIPSAPPGMTGPSAARLPAPDLFESSQRALNPSRPERQSLLGRVHDALVGGLIGDAPQGYENMPGVTPDMIKQTRPGILHSMFGAPDALAPQAEWAHNLDQIIGRQQAGTQMNAQNTLQTKRAQIQQQLGPAPQDQAGFENWVRKAYGLYTGIGDMESLQHLNAVMQQITAKSSAQPKAAEHIDLGDRMAIMDPTGTKIIATYPKGIAPKTASEISAEQKNSQDQSNKILDDYARDTKDFHQVMAGWDVLQGAVKNPSLATPFAITDAYARITNPGAIVRPTTMEMIDHMGSLGQRMRKAWEHNANGALPPDIMKDFQRTLYNIVNEHKKQYDQIRSKAVERGRRSKVDIAPLLEDYMIEDPLAPKTPVPGARTGTNPLLRKP